MLDRTTGSEPLFDFDPFGWPFREDPHSHFATLLSKSPVRIEVGGKPAVVISRYEQVKAIVTDFKRFSSARPAGTPGMERVDFFNGFPVMNYSDPPHHTYLRRLVGPCFSAPALRKLKGSADEIVRDLLDGLGEHPTFNAVADFGMKFSTRLLLNTFVGIPPEDEHIFIRYLKAVPLLDKVQPGGSKPQEFLDAWAAGVEYCQRSLDWARANDQQNLARLIADQAEGGKITADEIMATMMVLFSGGLTTVAATVGGALLYLSRYPEIAERVRRDPETAELVLEETIRLNPAVTQVMRFPTEDVEFEGMRIAKDTPLYAMLIVACHDPSVFPDPLTFDIDRPNLKEHLGFSAGVHTCIGNVIVRAVMPALIAEVARRYPELRLANPDEPLKYQIDNPRIRHIVDVRVQG
jgi:cytochrome P450